MSSFACVWSITQWANGRLCKARPKAPTGAWTQDLQFTRLTLYHRATEALAAHQGTISQRWNHKADSWNAAIVAFMVGQPFILIGRQPNCRRQTKLLAAIVIAFNDLVCNSTLIYNGADMNCKLKCDVWESTPRTSYHQTHALSTAFQPLDRNHTHVIWPSVYRTNALPSIYRGIGSTSGHQIAKMESQSRFVERSHCSIHGGPAVHSDWSPTLLSTAKEIISCNCDCI